MIDDLVFALLLLGHILGDFYLQWDKLASEKSEVLGKLVLHDALYAISMGAVLLGMINWSGKLLWVVLIATLSHVVVDGIKTYMAKRSKKNEKEKPRFLFTFDQLAHISIITALWLIWGRDVTVRGWVADFSLDFLNVHPMIALLGLLCVLIPVGRLIGSGDIWDLSRMQSNSDCSQKGAGRMIGYLERFIVFFLLINGEFSPIGFVITAKAVIRFPEIGDSENKRAQAEYYLIGTLLSMTFVFIVSLLLGLIRSRA